MAKIIRYVNSQDMPECLQLKEGDLIRFNGGKYWWKVEFIDSNIKVAYVRKHSRWGFEYRAITLEKQEESKDLFDITYFWHIPAEAAYYTSINRVLYECIEADTLLPQFHNIYSLEIKSKKIRKNKGDIIYERS